MVGPCFVSRGTHVVPSAPLPLVVSPRQPGVEVPYMTCRESGFKVEGSWFKVQG